MMSSSSRMAEKTPADKLRRRLDRLVSRQPAPPPKGNGSGRLRKTPGKMLRAKPPNIRGRGPLLDGPPLRVAIVAIVKNEADYLEEWLAYHLALGVDHFFLYDNGSTDGSAELLERTINHGLVTRIDWPIGGGQLPAYNHALRMFGNATEWLAFYDPDEFLVPLLDEDIPSLLARYPDAADLRIPRVEFGFSGHRAKPEGLAIDNYTHVANVLELDPKLPPRVKSIVRPQAVSAVDIHLAFPADVPAPGQPTRTYEAELRGVAQLSHYYTRSWEEFEAKRFRGSATGRIARPSVGFDVPTIEINDAASRYSERTQAMIERLRRLDPSALPVRQPDRLRVLPPAQRPLPLRRVRRGQLRGRPGRAQALRHHPPQEPLPRCRPGRGHLRQAGPAGYATRSRPRTTSKPSSSTCEGRWSTDCRWLPS